MDEMSSAELNQYLECNREHLQEVGRNCPAALGFIKRVYAVIEWSLAG